MDLTAGHVWMMVCAALVLLMTPAWHSSTAA